MRFFALISVFTTSFLFVNLSFGQTQLQVVSKTVEKIWAYNAESEVNIEGDKAEMRVETWKRNEVKIVMEIVSKHPEKAVAEKDLDAMIYSADQHGEKIYFRNYIDKAKKPASDLSAIYTITLPEDCPVYLKNHFGLTYVTNLVNELTINSEFSKVFLDNLKGTIGVNTRFGDLEGRDIDGNVTINSRRSDITLHQIKGNWDVNMQYGVLKMFTSPFLADGLLSLDIDAEKADVYFFDPEPTKYGYNLVAHYANITAPTDLKFNYLENTTELKKAIFSSEVGKRHAINIKISFGDIVIRKP